MKKIKVDWVNVDPKVSELVRKIAPAAYFRGLDAVIALEDNGLDEVITGSSVYCDDFPNYFISGLLLPDKKGISSIMPLSRKERRKIFLFLDRLETYLGKDYNNDEIRRLEEIFWILHELCHNYDIQEGRFYAGLYEANPIYHKKVERKADEISKKLLESYREGTMNRTKNL
jgi:hypothetical protein